MKFQLDYNYISYHIDAIAYNKTYINSKSVQTKRSEYTMLNYDPTYVCFDDKTSQLYRSVVLSSNKNHLLSFSPPKSVDVDEFIKTNPKIDTKIWANEFIEGTIIN